MKIATFGDINIDVVLTVDRLPGPGEEVFSSHRLELLGGSAANTAVVLARLGHEVAVMGAVGQDHSGEAALKNLETNGVSTALSLRTPDFPTAMNTIMVTPDGERTMIGARGANVAYRYGLGWESSLDWLHISGYSLMEGTQRESAIDAIHTAVNLGIGLSIDIPRGVAGQIREVIGSQLGGFSIVAGNRASVEEITNSADPAAALVDQGVGRVAIASGPNPLVLAEGPNQVTITPPLVRAVDATGAGDAMIAGLVSASLLGLELGPSAVLAAACGAGATLVGGASETLANPDTWHHLLRPELWTDARPEWIREIAELLEVDPGHPGSM